MRELIGSWVPLAACAAGLLCVVGQATGGQETQRLAGLDRIHGGVFRFGGVLGGRIQANVENWLLRAPAANPAMLEMFATRDRAPKPDLVPWAGEFVGKYLISAVQAMRMSDDPKLAATVKDVVDRLLASQAEDGYLGPWPKAQRLLGHWDLWGHYHVMLALMMWHEDTGDARALAAARRAADLICKTYLGTKRRVLDAGSPEMNMAVIHAMAVLHRKSGERRYLDMALEIVKDLQKAGDYLRTGLAGREFHRTPKPRWESLHALQSLAELFRTTGDDDYLHAFLNHWASIRRFDQRNSGAFSSREQATGDPYEETPIETCCTIAWMAVMVDALRLTNHAWIADDLERSTFNAVCAAQHPSGSWWTYDTPMNGRRKASFHDIIFQARPGAPELNCCSVNGPRGLGMLSEWAVMRRGQSLVVNYYGPCRIELDAGDGQRLGMEQITDYPVSGEVKLRIVRGAGRKLPLLIRIPAWCTNPRVGLNGAAEPGAPAPGTYVAVARTWKNGDEIQLHFDMPLRYEAGDLEQYGRASLYRGPILLAYDQRFNDFDEDAIPTVDPAKLSETKALDARDVSSAARGGHKPWLLVDLPADGGKTIRLCDFASAGAGGTHYRTWLAAKGLRPPAPVPWQPCDRQGVAPGAILFRWRRPAQAALSARTHTLTISRTSSQAGDDPRDEIVFESKPLTGDRFVLPAEQARKLKPGTEYCWRLAAANAHGRTESLAPHKRFRIDPKLPPRTAADVLYGQRTDSVVVAAPLRGTVEPEYGTLAGAQGWQAAAGPAGKPGTAVQTTGQSPSMVLYSVPQFPEADYSVSIWVMATAMPGGEHARGQVLSAWCVSMDDPLRVCIEGGRLFARVEAGGKFYSTQGVGVKLKTWYHVAAVKKGATLTLYVNGAAAGTAKVPPTVSSAATDFAVGGNPHFTGFGEFLAGRFADLRFYVRALSGEEVEALARQKPGAVE